jgi:release factor glutamine methyltransferase
MVAEDNARALQADNIRFLVSDWYEDLPVGLCFNLIVSNPPYIAEGDPIWWKATCGSSRSTR